MNQATLIRNKNIQALIKRSIVEIIEDILADPEYGLPLRARVMKRLQKYAKATPKKGISLGEFRHKHP